MGYLISARIEVDVGLEPVCCFDPTKVVARLRDAFPDLEVDSEDYALRIYDGLVASGASGAAVTAKADSHRRGPIWTFRFSLPQHSGVRGCAERYFVRFVSDTPIAEPFRSSLIGFLDRLKFASCVVVDSVRFDGDDEVPA